MRLAAATVVLCLIASPANAFQLTCADVRFYVAQYGKAKVIAYALRNGMTRRQIREAKRCLNEPR